jgi:hypothetical protein
MEKKPNKTWAIVGTIAALNGNSSTQPLPIYYGIGLICLSIIFIIIAIVVPVLTLRKKKLAPGAAPVEVLPPQEPLPPAS